MQANNRKALSLRVPADIAAEIESYALENGINKTDAYVHFLQVGLKHDAASNNATLESIDTKIDKVLSRLASSDARLGNSLPNRQEALDAIAEVSERYPGIERAWLFGSFARGQQREGSDIDVRLELDESHKFSLLDLASFAKLLEQATGLECDVITSRELKRESLALAVERDKVLAYERKDEQLGSNPRDA